MSTEMSVFHFKILNINNVNFLNIGNKIYFLFTIQELYCDAAILQISSLYVNLPW